jgi:hypothetical protein
MRSSFCQCACVSACPPEVARQRLGKCIHEEKNTHATIQELCTWCFICGLCRIKYSISSEKKVGDYIFPEVLVCT